MKNVYRYINKFTNDIEYVGIVYDRPLYKRIKEHAFMDKWNSEKYKVEYISCKSRTDIEYLEAHFIAKWKTYNYYNVAKKNMGKSNLIDDSSFEWIELHPFIVDGFSIKVVAQFYAENYLKTPDDMKCDYYRSVFHNIKGEENYLFFREVDKNLPFYIKRELFNTTNEMIEVSLDYKYLVVSLKYLPAFTEAFYLTDNDKDYVYLKGVSLPYNKKISKREYHEYLTDIINSFCKIKTVFEKVSYEI